MCFSMLFRLPPHFPLHYWSVYVFCQLLKLRVSRRNHRPRRRNFLPRWIFQSDGPESCRKILLQPASDSTLRLRLAPGRSLLSSTYATGFCAVAAFRHIYTWDSSFYRLFLTLLVGSVLARFLRAAARLCSPSPTSPVPCPAQASICRPPSAVQVVSRAGGRGSRFSPFLSLPRSPSRPRSPTWACAMAAAASRSRRRCPPSSSSSSLPPSLSPLPLPFSPSLLRRQPARGGGAPARVEPDGHLHLLHRPRGLLNASSRRGSVCSSGRRNPRYHAGRAKPYTPGCALSPSPSPSSCAELISFPVQ